eukprot:872362-Lingulodinium_polyedra.AAC.1
MAGSAQALWNMLTVLPAVFTDGQRNPSVAMGLDSLCGSLPRLRVPAQVAAATQGLRDGRKRS